MALASGATLAGYTVARRLGSGVTGEVYLAQDPQSVRWVALKVLSPASSSDSEFRRRFHAETPIAVNLYHPHIVEVHDRGESGGQLWLAMDYIEGINTAQLMAERFPAVSSAGEVLAIITGVAEALDYAHSRGLLHRDVKPANILLTGRDEGEPRVLLSDFGITRHVGEPTGTDIPADTDGYAAPEQLSGGDVDDVEARADQYALAATAFQLLTGAPPADHADPAPGSAPPRLSDQRPELARLDEVFCRALARNPADRFASCGEFAAAANEAAGVSSADRSPDAVFAAAVHDYPAYAWLETDDTTDVGDLEAAPSYRSDTGTPKRRGMALNSAAEGLVRRLDDFSAGNSGPAKLVGPPPAAPPRRRRSRVILRSAAVVLLVVCLVAAGIVIGRRTGRTLTQPASPSTSAPVAGPPPTTTGAPGPIPLDGSYRLEVQRSKQTFNYIPDPQPPDVYTWWAFRSSCTPTACAASGMLLADHTHAQPGEGHLVMHFADGQWLSEAITAEHACGGNGADRTQTTTQVLSLRPQPQGDLVGEMTVTVQSNECGQRAAVIRIPAIATRTAGVPTGLNLPDPGTLPGTATDTPVAPTVAPSGPGR
jgi:serine/threonine-protein kinase